MVVAVRAILESVSGAMTLAARATTESGLCWSENARTSGRRLVMSQAYIVSSALMPDKNPSRLLKVLGVAFGLAIIVGNTIGAGILRSPGDVAAALPHPAWFIGDQANSIRAVVVIAASYPLYLLAKRLLRT